MRPATLRTWHLWLPAAMFLLSPAHGQMLPDGAFLVVEVVRAEGEAASGPFTLWVYSLEGARRPTGALLEARANRLTMGGLLPGRHEMWLQQAESGAMDGPRETTLTEGPNRYRWVLPQQEVVTGTLAALPEGATPTETMLFVQREGEPARRTPVELAPGEGEATFRTAPLPIGAYRVMLLTEGRSRAAGGCPGRRGAETPHGAGGGYPLRTRSVPAPSCGGPSPSRMRARVGNNLPRTGEGGSGGRNQSTGCG